MVDKEAKKRHILEVSRPFFVDKGMSAPITEVAKACDMSVGSLYNYFDSKEHLYLECLGLGEFGNIHEVVRSHPHRKNFNDSGSL